MSRPNQSNDGLYTAVELAGNYTMAMGIIEEAIRSGYAQELVQAARDLAEWRQRVGDYPLKDVT